MVSENSQLKGAVFNIQKFSVHDGPGIRTVVFLKGCPLRCIWCSNPESQQFNYQLLYFADQCTGCGRCVEVCPESAISEPGKIEREKCTVCGTCIETCPAGALRLAGEERTVADIIREVVQDQPFFRRSGGGLTLSGGEPVSQPQFSFCLLKEAVRNGINTALETSGFCDFDDLTKICSTTDYVLYDIKHMDPEKHQELTGKSNSLILRNLKRLTAFHSYIIIRLPIIPGLNDDKTNLEETARFINTLDRKSIRRIEIMSFHQFGRAKYEMLDMPYPLAGKENAESEKIMKAIQVLQTSIHQIEVMKQN